MDYRPIVSALKIIHASDRVRRLAWGCVFVTGMFATAAIISAVRWW